MNGKLISYLKRATNIIGELDKIVSEFRKYNENKIADKIDNIKDDLVSSIKDNSIKLSSDELNEYQQFVSDIMEEKGVEEKHHLKKLPEIMKEVSERWEKKSKTALYWKNKDRKYSLSQDEMNSKTYICPSCKSPLSKKTYKMRAKLYVCTNPDCLFMIKKDDIVGLAASKLIK
jgi:flagellin-specific chaperone FliS